MRRAHCLPLGHVMTRISDMAIVLESVDAMSDGIYREGFVLSNN